MRPTLFANWCVWAFLSLIIFAGTTVYKLSSGTVLPIKLIEGQEATTSLVRVFPAAFSLELWIPKGDEPKKFGRCDYKKFNNKIVCEELPPRILIKAEINDQSETRETMPVSGIGSKIYTHYTIPFIEDGNPYVFHRPENIQLLTFTSIMNDVKFTIVNVEKKLEGEMIEIYVRGAIPFKFEPKGGYRLFWWFHFWPFYIVFLVCYALILLYKTIKSRKKNYDRDLKIPKIIF